jgi:hypothetical protein
MSRPTTRVALLLAALAAALLACTHHDSGRADSTNPDNAAESEAVKQALAKLPGVLRVDGGYAKNASDPGGVNLSITTKPGTEPQPVVDAALKQVWLSHLNPCSSAIITVGPDDNPSASITRDYDLTHQATELTNRYGPRPTS